MFEVKQNGSAAVRDLGSTNGSYVVRDNGDLLRLPVDAEFMLPSSPMRMQFGDVPADFIRIDDVEHDQQLPVPDLFGYAVNEAPQEPDAADMSVDDIWICGPVSRPLRSTPPAFVIRLTNSTSAV